MEKRNKEGLLDLRRETKETDTQSLASRSHKFSPFKTEQSHQRAGLSDWIDA